MKRSTQLNLFAWALSALTSLVVIIAWGQARTWQLGSLDALSVFPLLGLLALSLLWSQYMVRVVRHRAGVDKTVLKKYFEITSSLVMIAILLHPGLLIVGLLQLGAGLAAPLATWGAILGALALLILLFHDLYGKFQMASWWKYVEIAADLAMLAIVVHSFKPSGIWYIYSLTLVLAIGYLNYQKFGVGSRLRRPYGYLQ